MGTELVKYTAMCRAIDAAYQVDEVKNIRDTAIALETYARQARNIEAERQACEIRIRAERKAGQLSAKLEKSKGGQPKKNSSHRTKGSKAQQLADAGISKDQAHQWEKLAKIADKDFEQQMSNTEGKPTTNGLIRASVPPSIKPHVSREALWVWGRLREFDRMIVSREPEDVLFTLTDKMADDIKTSAPRVAAWLKRIK
jgi:hypothetical protein